MRAIAILCFALALGGIGYWFVDGMRYFDVEQVLVEKVEKDEIFGTETTTQVWKNEYHPGLLGALGIGIGSAVAIGGVLLIVDIRRRRRASA